MIRRILLAGATAAALAAVVAVVDATRPAADANPAADGTDSTLALAPISLGNPHAAATLHLFLPAEPDAGTAAAPPATYTVTLRAERGDTFAKLLRRAGVSGGDAAAAIDALAAAFDPRRLRPGQEIAVALRPAPAAADAAPALVGLEMALAFPERVRVARGTDGGFAAETETRATERTLLRAEGRITTSLYGAAVGAGVPLPALADLIRIYSWDVDFQRDIQPGDGFEVLYEGFADEAGETVHVGEVVYAALSLSGKRRALYRFEGDHGTEYFDDTGASARKALLRTPIDGARLSSRYGKRRHPILGYTKMHRGVDFAAPTGTPIYAAGNGSVDFVGRRGAYGKYLRIRHNTTYSTAYAHLSRYAKGMRRGKRVSQGDVIAYVGSTGRSTGPHLHYEILKNGRQTNPLTVKMPSGRKLRGAERDRFLETVAETDAAFAALEPATGLAVASGE